MTRKSWLIGLVAAVSATACTQRTGAPASLAQYNLIVINIDALRADHLGCYGYARHTSPFIDTLAAHGVVFEDALSNSSYTRESVATLFSGRLPSQSGSVGWEAKPAADGPRLAQLFKAAGYATGFLSNTTMLGDPAFTTGFDEVEQLADAWGISGTGPKLSKRAVEFVRRHRAQQFMLYLHYLDPHGPYDPPADLYRQFTASPQPHPLDVYRDVRPHCVELVREGFGPGDARFEDMVVRYDAEIADTDRSIAMLFAGLDEVGVRDRTLVVLSADHGEEFLDHGFVEHAWTLYQESLHVPLVLWAPRVLAAKRVSGRVSVVDIAPTVLGLMHIPHTQPGFDGSPLVESDGGVVQYAVPAKPYVGELLIAERNVLRAVISGRWKYVAAQRWLPPAERPAAVAQHERLAGREPAPAVDLWGPVVHEELYDLQVDPHERVDLASTTRQPLNELRSLLATYETQAKQHASGPARARPQALSPADAERLKSLGYLQ